MSLEVACRKVVRDALVVRAGEPVLIVTDLGDAHRIPRALAAAVQDAGGVPLILQTPPCRTDLDVPHAVRVAMNAAGPILLCTSWLFPHETRRSALTSGARLLSLCTVTEGTLLRAGDVDYAALAQTTQRTAVRFERAAMLEMTTPAGTAVRASIRGRRVIRFDGIAAAPGASSGIPAGVVATTPVPGSASGTVVLDGSLDGFGLLPDRVVLSVEDGRVMRIEGGEAARWLERRWADEPAEARWVAEFGVGTNPAATYCGNLVEDERVLGSAHVGFGRNTHLGGDVARGTHLDACMRQPTVMLDGAALIRDGRLTV